MQDGRTPLLVASRAGSAVVVKLLLKNKANLHYQDPVCMGSMFEGRQCVLWYFRVHGLQNGRMLLVTKGCGMVFSVFVSSGRMYRLKAVVLLTVRVHVRVVRVVLSLFFVWPFEIK